MLFIKNQSKGISASDVLFIETMNFSPVTFDVRARGTSFYIGPVCIDRAGGALMELPAKS